jgi:crotonobetainyl-CoA:carnitine CoA-transferase CaiB-like acyl-CoA transferase
MSAPLPLEGLRVIEFTHMVMGPTCGMILGDLGAEVIKVEPLAGDKHRD